MKIDINDPRITAFALGELSGDDAIELARAVRSDGRIRAAVDEVRETAQLLGTVLSPAGAEMLTSEQRAAVRSVGTRPEITDIASARVPFWKKPVVIATGAAAAVAATLFLVADQPPVKEDSVADQNPGWNWSQMDTRDLTSPVVVDYAAVENAPPSSEAALAVGAAMSEDTDGYRNIVKQRIESSDMVLARNLPALDTKDWLEVTRGQRIAIPLSSGAASWPWLKRYIMEAGKIPPKGAVRIEEMVNHFTYRKPSMIRQGGLAADVEFCRNPWNAQTCLLAVHVMASPGADVNNLQASLVIHSGHVEQLRMLGYATAAKPEREGTVLSGTPAIASRTRGNYVLYEVVLAAGQTHAADAALVSLALGEGEIMISKGPVDWVNASADMRFASAIAAMGMMLSDYPAVAELDAGRLASMLELVRAMDGKSMQAERQKALKLAGKALEIVKKDTH